MSTFIRNTSSNVATIDATISNELLAPLEGADGFGCPDDYKCSDYCRSIGYNNGYCSIWSFNRRCVCK
ncbi:MULTISPECIES: actinodefensin [Corynebacterium]|uniref:actinodefensin n=1 Tax=Corynebacterium TaxID=1716 RepID=UPI0009F21B05|nr:MULTISPECIES: actinodefensin [Corynebacterium]MDK8877583.1 actinodefensin [Corynebacterium striatum]